MDIALQIISLFGGLGMFLFGMNSMSSSLERAAGSKLRRIMEKVTGNIFKSVALGAIVAALTQSSSATTVMVVGFVNAGVLTLTQAVGIIMGANIGTTITAWILSLNDLPGDVWYLAMLKPSTLAPLFIIFGAVTLLFFTKKNIKNIGEIFVGLGLIFIGMEFMTDSMEVVFDQVPALKNIFATQTNPFVGLLMGAGITGIIQSSAASVGMLQAVASGTTVVFASAFPIIMGQNIGTCVTALLSSVGAGKNAKRAAMIHLYFNIIGTIIFLSAIYLIQFTIGLPFWDAPVSASDISLFHSVFNVVSTIILIPFSKGLVWLAEKTIRDSKEKTGENPFSQLDERFLKTPYVAVGRVHIVLSKMFKVAKTNVELAAKMIEGEDAEKTSKVMTENENLLDEYEIRISSYLTKISDENLSEADNERSTIYYHLVSNIERIGDYCDNIREICEDLRERNLGFSEEALHGLGVLFTAIDDIVALTYEAFSENDKNLAIKIEPLEEVVDEIREQLEDAHMARLKARECSVEAGVMLLEITGNAERISDQCSNIGIAILQANGDKSIDRHEYLRRLHREMPEDYRRDYEIYKQKYAI